MSASLNTALKAQDAVWQMQQLLKDARGASRDAINMAIDYMQVGLLVPKDIAGVIANHTSFKQDRYGH